MKNETPLQPTNTQEIALRLASLRSKDAIVSRFIESARDITGAGYGAIEAHWGTGTPTFAEAGIPKGTLARLAARSEQKELFANVPERRFLIVNDSPALVSNIQWPATLAPLESFLGIPIAIDSTFFARVCLANKPDGFTRLDARSVLTLAEAATLAVRNVNSRSSLSPTEASPSAPSDTAIPTRRAKAGRAGFAASRQAEAPASSLAAQIQDTATQLTAIRDSLASQPTASQPILNRIDAVIASLSMTHKNARELSGNGTPGSAAGTE